MPSGAKKRKAAKKKKESQSNNHSIPSPASTHSHGDEDAKHQEDKESDAGEVSSPASQDHHSHQNLLTEGEEEEIEKQRTLSNPPPEQELKIEGGGKNGVLEGNVIEVEREFKIEDESDKKHGSVGQDEATRKSYDGGSSGSSSGECSDDESPGMKNSQAAGDVAPVVDSMKISDSSPGKSSEAIHSAPINKADDSVEKTPYVAESVLDKNEVEKPSSAEDKVGKSTASADAALKKKEKEIVQSVANTATNPNECVTQESDDKLTLPHDAPRPTGADHETNYGVTEPSPVPLQGLVQRTSWKGCCGLFEVFSGSST